MLTREDILNHALALPPGDRELVAAALQDSLPDLTIARRRGERAHEPWALSTKVMTSSFPTASA